MNISCSPAGIVSLDFPRQGIGDMAGAGFESLFLRLDMCQYELFRNQYELFRKKYDTDGGETEKAYAEPGKYFEKLLGQCREKHLHISIAQAPFLPRNRTKKGNRLESENLLADEDLSRYLFWLHQESIRICGQAGCSYLIIKPPFQEIEYGREWEANRNHYLNLAGLARENGVMILLENQCREVHGHLVRGLCSDAGTAADWVRRLNEEAGEERFGFCLNVGTSNLCGQNTYEFAAALKDRLKAVILCDNDGNREASLLPFTCAAGGQTRTDWLSLLRGLREICFDGELVLDFADTASAFSPLLRPQLMALAKAAAEYFRWQIEIEMLLKKHKSRVLFGAGNMCRNYMKCYGEQYPPLFTCDNNERIWGTRFCGLDVRSPESLRELPEDCVIFICNIYYREIEKQLRDMDIRNPIEFFNDEYMPSFYFERLPLNRRR